MKKSLMVITLVLGVGAAAKADLKWTESMSMSSGGAAAEPAGEDGQPGFSISSTNYMSESAGRTDSQAQFGPMSFGSRQINLCTKNQSFLLDDDAKLFAAVPLRAASLMPTMPKMPMMGMPGGMPTPKKLAGPRPKGTLTIETHVRDLGAETILDVPTRHIALDMSTTATGCAGKGTTKLTMEFWQANFVMPAPCLQMTFDGAAKSSVNVDESQCDATVINKGDAKAMGALFNGFLMKTKFGVGGMTMTKQVTMISRAKLDSSVFSVPDDYKSVSEAELDAARQKAMMKKMMGGEEVPG